MKSVIAKINEIIAITKTAMREELDYLQKGQFVILAEKLQAEFNRNKNAIETVGFELSPYEKEFREVHDSFKKSYFNNFVKKLVSAHGDENTVIVIPRSRDIIRTLTNKMLLGDRRRKYHNGYNEIMRILT